MLNKEFQSVLKIFRKKDSQRIQQLPTFLKRLSTLLSEGYSFGESIQMLLPHHVNNPQLKQHDIEEKLRNGEGVLGVMRALELPPQLLISIRIAEHNGHLQEALAGMAKQLEFSSGMRERLKKLLVYPITLMLFLITIFILFRIYFFPNIERMFQTRGASMDEKSLQLSKFLLSMPEYLGVSIFIISILFLLVRKVLLSKEMAIQINSQLKMPIWNRYFQLIQTSQFSKHLGSLMLSGFSLQASLDILQQQDYQRVTQYCAEQLKIKVLQGEALVQAVQASQVFQRDFAIFVEHGEKSGLLGKELLLYSELLDERFEEKIQKLVTFIQPATFVVIACCILAAYLSILLPIYGMIEFV